ncbi:MAG: hypothetical protein KDC24_11405 [Saprospiraceae bacterium]|nr:hypothetical protein [Saprospiraceae bacterium]
MDFVDETIIENIVEKLGASDANFEKQVEYLKGKYPLRLGYLFSEDTEAFTNEEQSLVLFLGTVIISACEEVAGGKLGMVEEKDLMSFEEENWEKIQSATGTGFNSRLDVFFKDTDQEDLLAFIEDNLVDDEDNVITKEGREPIFILLKTMVDACTLPTA